MSTPSWRMFWNWSMWIEIDDLDQLLRRGETISSTIQVLMPVWCRPCSLPLPKYPLYYTVEYTSDFRHYFNTESFRPPKYNDPFLSLIHILFPAQDVHAEHIPVTNHDCCSSLLHAYHYRARTPTDGQYITSTFLPERSNLFSPVFKKLWICTKIFLRTSLVIRSLPSHNCAMSGLY